MQKKKDVKLIYGSCHALNFTALSSVCLLKQRKQIFQIKYYRVKNPNWQEADQLAIYKA